MEVAVLQLMVRRGYRFSDDQLFLGVRTTFTVGNYYGSGRNTSAWSVSQINAARRESGQDGIMEELTGTWITITPPSVKRI